MYQILSVTHIYLYRYLNIHDITWLICIYLDIFVHVPLLIHHTHMVPMGHGFLTGIPFTSQPGTKMKMIIFLYPRWDITPWKINMEPENDGLEDYFPFQFGDF